MTPRPEYPRPQMVREDWLNLNGPWAFEPDPGNSGTERGLHADGAFSREIVVPFAKESRLSGIGEPDFLLCCWYRRAFVVPETWAGRRVLLHFGAVDYEAEVWVNGVRVGGHRGGYTPFSFDITDALRPGENALVVRAFDDTRSPLQASGKQSKRFRSHGCDYTRTTGIWQTVWLEAVDAVHVRGLRIRPEPDAGRVCVEVDFAGAATVRASVPGAGEATTDAAGHAAFSVPLEGPRLWSPTDPFLYDLEVSLERGGRVVDRVKSYFGVRKIEIDGHRVLLNGKSQFMRLVLDQGFYPDGVYTAPSDEALRRDIELSMELGFDGARLHMKLFEPRFLYWADRLGYLVWGEFPNWGIDVNNPLAGLRYIAEWREAVARDLNHPALIGWCPMNETIHSTTEAGYLLHEDLYHVTKGMDPGRPCIDTSGYNHRVTDVYDVHDYTQDVAEFAKHYAPLADGKTGTDVFWNSWGPAKDHNRPFAGGPYFVSEYGGIWWDPAHAVGDGWGYGGAGARPKSPAEFLERYRGLTETLLRNPRVCGFCYTQLYDIEQEVNGLMTYERAHKFDPAAIRAINRQKAAIESP